jgi:transcriptional regulator with XRE-family HTH domain
MSSVHLLRVVKKALKARRISYRELAKKMKMSESGVKKMLGGEDISLRRLRRLADILGMPLVELIRLSEEGGIEEVRLSPAQEEQLVREPALFRFYWKHVIEKMSLEEISRQFALSKKEIQDYGKKLEKLGLSLKESRLFRWVNEGPLLQKINREWSEMTLLRSLLLEKNERRGVHRLVYLSLSQKSQEDLVRRLGELMDEFAYRSEREEISQSPADLHPTSLLIAAVPESFVNKIK